MMSKFLARIRGASADRKGVSAAEYAILAVGVILVVGTAVAGFTGQITTAFSRVGSAISSAGSTSSR